MRRIRSTFVIVTITTAHGALLAAAIALALRSRAIPPPARWGEAGSPERIALATGAVVGIMLAAGLLLGALATIATRTTPDRVAWQRLAPFTLPVVHRLLDRALVVALGLGTIVVPAGAARAATATSGDVPVVRVTLAAEPVVDQPVVRGPAAPQPAPTTTPPTTTPATTTPATTTPATTTPPGAAEPAGSPDPAPAEHVIRAGEHLWSIAEQHVTAAGVEGGAPSDQTVARYWARLVDANRDRLRSGNPSLVFPGEIVILPALT